MDDYKNIISFSKFSISKNSIYKIKGIHKQHLWKESKRWVIFEALRNVRENEGKYEQ